MTLHLCAQAPRPSLSRASAGVLAASIAAAAIVGMLTLMQSVPVGPSAAAAVGADSAVQRDAAGPLDAGVDWRHVEDAPEPHGTSVAAYER